MRGSIVKRGKTYSYVLYLGRDETGKKRQKWVGGFRTKRECSDALTEALERKRTGTWGDPGRQTVAEYLRQWMDATGPSLRDSTRESYAVVLDAWVIPRIGRLRLAALDAARIGALYGELRTSGRRDGKGLSPRSVRYAHALLNHALGDAFRWGLLPRNPAALVDPPRQVHKEMQVWGVEDVRAFLAHVAEDRFFAMWLLMIATGMRRGEALGLRWPDVDLEHGTVAIRRARIVVDGWRVAEEEPKTARGRRVVPLDPDTVAALAVHRKAQVAERLRAGDVWQGEDGVFCDELGRPPHPQAITRRFGALVGEAGLPAMPLHGLRHTSATLALAAGIHGKVVSGRLGHSTVGITLDLYTHPVQDVETAAAAKIGALIHPQAN